MFVDGDVLNTFNLGIGEDVQEVKNVVLEMVSFELESIRGKVKLDYEVLESRSEADRYRFRMAARDFWETCSIIGGRGSSSVNWTSTTRSSGVCFHVFSCSSMGDLGKIWKASRVVMAMGAVFGEKN